MSRPRKSDPPTSPLTVRVSSAFARDIKLAEKRRWEIDKIDTVLEELRHRRPLARTHRDHPLKGDWQGYRDCHIEGDWVLIYRVEGDCLMLARTGTHSDLFE